MSDYLAGWRAGVEAAAAQVDDCCTIGNCMSHDVLEMAAANIRALPAPDAADGWEPTHQHRKGGLYRVIRRAEMEADLSLVVVYDDAAGRVWVRPASEFDDGRFIPLPAPPKGDDP